MKIQIPKVIIQVPMRDYAPELDGTWLYVWVNPSMDRLDEYNQLVTALQEQELESARKILDPALSSTTAVTTETPLKKAFDQMARWLTVKKEQPQDGLDRKLLDWYAEIWNQGPPETHWTISELRTLERQDPAFLSWMIAQTWRARATHMEQKKKA